MKKILIMIVAGCVAAVFFMQSGCSRRDDGRVYRVGILTSFQPFMDIAEGFIDRMAEMGYVEGENIVYDIQIKHLDPQGAEEAVRKFIEDDVDLIFTFPTDATVVAHQITEETGIPVVFAFAGLEGNNIVESVRSPGGNATGVRFPGPDNIVLHLELLQKLKPDMKTVWVTYDPDYPNTPIALDTLRPACQQMGLTLLEAPNTDAAGVAEDLKKYESEGAVPVDAILLLPEKLSQSEDVFKVLLPFSLKHNAPIGGGVPYMTQQGAIFSLLPNEVHMGRLAAPIARKVLEGMSPAVIPVVTPENELWFNYDVARAMGLNVTDGLLSQVTELIRETP